VKKKIAVLGAGAWGTAVAHHLASKGHSVLLWCFESAIAADINEYCLNKKYLPDIELHEGIIPTSSLPEALETAEIVCEAIPMPFLRATLKPVASHVTNKQIWVVLSKGIENETLLFPSEVLEDIFDSKPPIVALGGPNFAFQVAQLAYTATQIASKNASARGKVATAFASDSFKVFQTNDIYGVQVGAALKNMMALFLGLLEGHKSADNTRAYFVIRCLKEMVVAAKHYGGESRTIYGLSGLGDLIIGMMGEKSRNYFVGTLLGSGKSLNEVSQLVGHLPEGINTTKSIYQIINKVGLDLPICLGLYRIVFEGKSIQATIDELF